LRYPLCMLNLKIDLTLSVQLIYFLKKYISTYLFTRQIKFQENYEIVLFFKNNK
jgi:hypothetical protein